MRTLSPPIPLLAVWLSFSLTSAAVVAPDVGCESYQSWQLQGSVKSDPLSIRDIAFPEANATYWGTFLSMAPGSELIIRGRYPGARYTSLEIYNERRNVVDALRDAVIVPDPGQNNPYVSGTAAGTYTVRIVAALKPAQPAPNTIYTNRLPTVLLLYRIYYPNNPADLTGGATNPVLPEIYNGTTKLSTCPPRPIITPETNTVWGREDEDDFSGVPPVKPTPANQIPVWNLSVTTNGSGLFFPSEDNSYLTTILSRDFFTSPTPNDLVVVRFRAPTFAYTQGGEPSYLALTTRQVRFWSVCTNEILSTGVVRCLPDYQAPLRDGMVTVVVSDPSKKPSAETLAAYSAAWLPWGALVPGDRVYDIDGNLLDNNSGVFYQNAIIYRQTSPNPSWSQSMAAVGALPRAQWRTAMGDYWPVAGYCSLQRFTEVGPACFTPRR